MRAFLLLLASAVLAAMPACGSRLSQYQEAPVKEGRVVIPLSGITPGAARFYTYKGGSRPINFFVRVDREGTASAFYDACFTCYKKKKGYQQEGPNLICRECSMKFGISDPKWDEKDGCNPIHLKSAVEGSNLIIETSVISKGEKLF